MTDTAGNAAVTREYAYDSQARPVTRRSARQGNTVNDSFACNSRSELTAAVSGRTYGYSYDNIGNRKTAREDAEEATTYTTGPLNQYTAIERGEEAAFEPVHDADGNQTLIRTSTGIWQVAYNAENRPVRFGNESAKTVAECTYDYMGRRHTRKVSVNGTVSSYLRYMYRGYLQIAAIDAVSGVFRWFLFRDPTQHYAPAGHPQRRRLIRLRVGSDQERHGNLREKPVICAQSTPTRLTEKSPPKGTSPSPSSGAANTARKNSASSTTTTVISIRLTAGRSAAIPSWKKTVGICIYL